MHPQLVGSRFRKAGKLIAAAALAFAGITVPARPVVAQRQTYLIGRLTAFIHHRYMQDVLKRHLFPAGHGHRQQHKRQQQAPTLPFPDNPSFSPHRF